MGELYRIGSLVVNMRFRDDKQHHKPHVHAEYQGDEAVVGVDGELLAGALPLKLHSLLLEGVFMVGILSLKGD